ncbi:MAG: DoxX family membrane protein [Candidatus Paceibacterota bacterium]
MDSYKMQRFGFIVLRFGIAAVFLWFGIQQVMHPSQWVRMLPDWAILKSLPAFFTSEKIILTNGILEIIGAVLLILNIFTRIVALLLALHLAGIAWSFGLSPTGVRDGGLAIATFSLFLLGPRAN